MRVLSFDTGSIVKRICGQRTPADRMGKKLPRARGGDDWNAFRLFPADKYPGVRVECSTKEGAIGPRVLVTYSTGSKPSHVNPSAQIHVNPRPRLCLA